MKTLGVRSRDLWTATRLDCWYYLSPGREVQGLIDRACAQGLRTRALGGQNGIAERVHHPQRYTRALAALSEPSLPYLRPYDLFNYYPEPADYVSRDRTERLSDYHLK